MLLPTWTDRHGETHVVDWGKGKRPIPRPYCQRLFPGGRVVVRPARMGDVKKWCSCCREKAVRLFDWWQQKEEREAIEDE